jgi:predicted TIM-barrel fold metal-dependent hydrolase
VLDRHPKVNFIGHAQTWWCNIDKACDQKTMYPAGPVTPGGISDRLLSDYPNMYGDLSAGSGLNSMLRDEAHARDFLKRHQDKLLFGSDCNDRQANGPNCLGAKIIAAVRRLAPDMAAERKMLYGNASKLLKISV